MNSLKEYITEKFKISKDINNVEEEPLFSKEDAILKITICLAGDEDNNDFSEEDSTIYLGGPEIDNYGKVFYFDKIENNTLYYFIDNQMKTSIYDKDEKDNIFINKKGFYQCSQHYKENNSHWYYYSIYLNKDKGIEFIDNCWPSESRYHSKLSYILLEDLKKYMDINLKNININDIAWDCSLYINSTSDNNINKILHELSNAKS